MLQSLEVRENCKQFVLVRGSDVPRLTDCRWVCQNVERPDNPRPDWSVKQFGLYSAEDHEVFQIFLLQMFYFT